MLYIKQYKYADKDIKKLIGSIVVLVDTREKQNRHITDYFDKNNIAYEPTTLSYGDYSFYIPADVAGENIYYHRDIVIERKASLEEISSNLTKERERFEKELSLAPKEKVLLIENANYSDVANGNYNTQYNKKSF